MAEFNGFPEAALDFYDDLEMDNTKSFWEEHRATYDEAVAAPMRALVGELEPNIWILRRSASAYAPAGRVKQMRAPPPSRSSAQIRPP